MLLGCVGVEPFVERFKLWDEYWGWGSAGGAGAGAGDGDGGYGGRDWDSGRWWKVFR